MQQKNNSFDHSRQNSSSHTPSSPQQQLFQIPIAENQKPTQQLLQQIYQLTRRITQSDRNNQAFRDLQKAKKTELNSLRKNKEIVRLQYEEISKEKHKKSEAVKEAHRSKNKNQEIFDTNNKLLQNFHLYQKDADKKNLIYSKQNEKLEKKMHLLQMQLDDLIIANKEKQKGLSKLKKKKEEKQKILQDNQKHINQLQSKCDNTKNKAQRLEQQLKVEIQIQRQLTLQLFKKEAQLRQKLSFQQETSRKQEDQKRQINKLMSSAKSIQQQIDRKVSEVLKLEQIFDKLQSKIMNVYDSQKKLDELISKRRQFVTGLSETGNRFKKEKDYVKDLIKKNFTQ